MADKCRKYFYSLSINPDPAQGPLSRAEQALGLVDQPRAVVFHTKYGREHCHVVWSRVQPEQEKAVHIAYGRDKLMRAIRAPALDHHLELPEGYTRSRKTKQMALLEYHHEQKTGLKRGRPYPAGLGRVDA
jgi:hypothetical protein